MLWIQDRLGKFVELKQQMGVLAAAKRFVYHCEELVPVEKELRPLPATNPVGSDGVVVELLPANIQLYQQDLQRTGRWYRACRYLRQGYRGFGIVKDDCLRGEIWSGRRGDGANRLPKGDFQMLGIEPGPDEVYLFDMFVAPQARGHATATTLMNGALQQLANEGCTKAYGFFVATNLPALWVHRLLKYRELPRVHVKRLLLWRRKLAGVGA